MIVYLPLIISKFPKYPKFSLAILCFPLSESLIIYSPTSIGLTILLGLSFE